MLKKAIQYPNQNMLTDAIKVEIDRLFYNKILRIIFF